MSFDGTRYMVPHPAPLSPSRAPTPVIDCTPPQQPKIASVPEVGTRVGGIYRILGQLGSGAMGIVLLAEDETLGRKVAIKFVRGDLLDAGFRTRFTSEAQAMARVSHPNMLQIHAFGEHDGAPYFVMELVSGVTLDKWLTDNGVPNVDVALRMLRQICAGVAAIHAAETVHRDIKPSNVLIDASEHVRIADLGLAVFRSQPGTNKREIVGTPAYMAPEVAFPSPADEGFAERADVYSLGCVAYELLTGKPPFVAEGAMAIMFHHATKEVVPPSVLRPGIPQQLDEAILHALAKRPADRTATVKDFDAALEAVREGLTMPTRILIAEDNDDFREVLELGLRIAFPNAAFDCVTDGRAALEAFDRNQPSVAILDLRMPQMNGIELTRLLRARDPSGVVPIIALTASGGPREWQLMSALGADRFLLKPIVLADVVSLVYRLLKDRADAAGSAASVRGR